MRSSITTITIALCVGVAIGILYAHSSFVVLLLLLIVTLQTPLLIFAKRKEVRKEIIIFVMVGTLSCMLGILRGQMYEEPILPNALENTVVTFNAKVLDVPEIKDTTQVFDVKEKEGDGFIFRVTSALYPKVQAGDEVILTGKIQKGDVVLPVAPNTSSFDYATYLHTKDIIGTIAFPKIEVKSTTESSFVYKLYSFKGFLVDKIYHFVPAPENALASGVLFGTNTLPKETQDEVRIAGLSHIIVLSGFNVAILVVFIMYLFRSAPFTLRIVASASLVTLFVIMVGGFSLQSGGASLLRSTIMVYVSLLALYLGKEYQALQALFFSLFVYVVLVPQALVYDISLHLSFLSTLGLILVSETIKNKVGSYARWKLPEWLLVLLSSTLSVLVFTTPYLVYTFGSFSLYSIFANILAVPVVSFLMAFTALLVVFSFVPFLSTVLAFTVYILSSLILEIAHIVANIPYAKISFSLSFFEMCISYVVVLVWMWYLHRKNKMVVSSDPSIISF